MIFLKIFMKRIFSSMVNEFFAVPLSPPRYLSFSELSHASVRVSWEAASQAVKAHHVTYEASGGSNTGEVSAHYGVPDTALFSGSSLLAGF